MIRAFVDYSLRNKLLVIAVGVLLLVWGAISFKNLPVEAYPDVANNYVQVITQWPGRAGEEVELKPRQVTIHTLELIEATAESATISATVSKGTYIRSLARDIGGLDHAYLSRMVRGQVPVNAAHASRIARHLGLPEDYFAEVREAKVIQMIRRNPRLRDQIYFDRAGKQQKGRKK